MKFLTYAFLIAGTAAISLKNFATIDLDKKVDEVTEDEWMELGKAIYAETENGETLEYPELEAAVVKWAKKHDVEPFKGWKKMLKDVFNEVDENNDGHVTRKEMDDAIKEHEEGEDSDDLQITSAKKVKDVTEEEWMELGKAIYAYTANGETLSFKELKRAVRKWAKKHDVKPFKGWKKVLKKIFKKVDTDNNGEVTRAEMDAAIAKHEEDDDLQLSGPAQTALLQVGIQGPKEDLEKAFKHVYTTGDKQMSLEEFEDIVDHVCEKYNHPAPTEAQLEAAFDAMDKDGNGQVTLKELYEFADKHAPK